VRTQVAVPLEMATPVVATLVVATLVAAIPVVVIRVVAQVDMCLAFILIQERLFLTRVLLRMQLLSLKHAEF